MTISPREVSRRTDIPFVAAQRWENGSLLTEHRVVNAAPSDATKALKTDGE